MEICFVCYGNICRSVMAEYMMKKMAADRGRKDISCFSRAASSHTEGMDIYGLAKKCLDRHGIPYSRHQAHKITEEDYRRSDRIYVMDEDNVWTLERLLEDTEGKISMLLETEIADPWYTGDFETTYKDLKRGIENILEEYL